MIERDHDGLAIGVDLGPVQFRKSLVVIACPELKAVAKSESRDRPVVGKVCILNHVQSLDAESGVPSRSGLRWSIVLQLIIGDDSSNITMLINERAIDQSKAVRRKWYMDLIRCLGFLRKETAVGAHPDRKLVPRCEMKSVELVRNIGAAMSR